MVYRQTRLTARLLFATIVGLAALALIHLGPDHLIPGRVRAEGQAGPPVPVWQGSLRACLLGLLWMLAHEQAARVRKWRRNIVRAGGVFATSWLGSLTLILAIQIMQLASSYGYEIDAGRGYGTVVGVLVLFRANLLPKSRPAWFNGVAFPVFAGRADIWREVHRASALRLLAIGIVILALCAFAPAGVDLIGIIMMLLLLELALATAHALWLGAMTRKEPAR